MTFHCYSSSFIRLATQSTHHSSFIDRRCCLCGRGEDELIIDVMQFVGPLVLVKSLFSFFTYLDWRHDFQIRTDDFRPDDFSDWWSFGLTTCFYFRTSEVVFRTNLNSFSDWWTLNIGNLHFLLTTFRTENVSDWRCFGLMRALHSYVGTNLCECQLMVGVFECTPVKDPTLINTVIPSKNPNVAFLTNFNL